MGTGDEYIRDVVRRVDRGESSQCIDYCTLFDNTHAKLIQY